MTRLLRGALLGAGAGAAGTTALDAVSYLDMAVRGRPASHTPEATVAKLAEVAHLPVPDEKRLAGLGGLSGLVVGAGVGALLGMARAAGWRTGTGIATVAVLLAANGPMTVLRITDPRTWSAVDWVSDILPHLAYGAVTVAMLDATSRQPAPAPRRPRARRYCH
ncbi:MAG: hypothetical protein JWN29_1279 [Acidimicrobiales bacterium]|nr:hypothetical protein [Acidimicrobiales bacterium]